MEPLSLLVAANSLLLLPVYFILRHIMVSVAAMRMDVLKLSSDHNFLRGRLESIIGGKQA